jgi:ribosome-associated protein
LAKLLRAIDLTDAQQFVDQLKFESQTEIKKFHKVEDWRDKLLADISNLTDFVNLSPGIDIQKLRKLILNTQREVKKGSSKKFQKELFQFIKETL